jgi:hypothetical protein
VPGRWFQIDPTDLDGGGTQESIGPGFLRGSNQNFLNWDNNLLFGKHFLDRFQRLVFGRSVLGIKDLYVGHGLSLF